MTQNQVNLAFLGGLTVYATYSMLLPSPTSLSQMDRPGELHTRMLIAAVMAVGVGILAAHFAEHSAPLWWAVTFTGLVSAIYLIEEAKASRA